MKDKQRKVGLLVKVGDGSGEGIALKRTANDRGSENGEKGLISIDETKKRKGVQLTVLQGWKSFRIEEE